MLTHTNFLEAFLNIRNSSLRKQILQMDKIDYQAASAILNDTSSQNFIQGEMVVLKIEKALNQSDPGQVYRVEQSKDDLLLLYSNSGVLCKIEPDKLLRWNEENENEDNFPMKIEENCEDKVKVKNNVQHGSDGEKRVIAMDKSNKKMNSESEAEHYDKRKEDNDQEEIQKREVNSTSSMRTINDTFVTVNGIEYCA